MKQKPQFKLIPPAAIIILLIACVSSAALKRGDVPQPPVDFGTGLNVGQADIEHPYVPGTHSETDSQLDEHAYSSLVDFLETSESSLPKGFVGGDDVTIDSNPLHRNCSTAIASNGDIYVALESGDFMTAETREIIIFRSVDGGNTWANWALFGTSVDYDEYSAPDLHIAEGTENRIYMAYVHNVAYSYAVIEVAYSNLGPEASWTVVEVFSDEDVFYGDPSITTDAQSYDYYYLYVVASGSQTDSGPDIWFSRSINQGSSYEAPYMVAEITLDDRGYDKPSVSYGYGGFVHVAWHFRHFEDATDEAIRYRRIGGSASSGVSGWDPIKYMTPSNNAIDERSPVVKASLTTNDVLLIYRRYDGSSPLDPGIFVSPDQGDTFAEEATIAGGLYSPKNIIQNPANSQWVMGGMGIGWNPAYQTASYADPTVWSPQDHFVDDSSISGIGSGGMIVMDPNHANRIGITWVEQFFGAGETKNLKFDAEWRSDPGYPVTARNYPLDLNHAPISPPAIVDLQNDGNKIIVFGDNQGRIQAFDSNGDPVSGFPIFTDHYLSDGPVAIGPLTPGHQNIIVAGTSDGWIVAYNADGTVANGFPVDLSSDEDVYVSIGNVGGPWVNVIAACYDNKLTYRDYKGTNPAELISWQFSGGRVFTSQAAFGDIDGDGANEVVSSPGEAVVAVDPRALNLKMSFLASSLISDAITLGDLDLDGDVEVLVPTENGTLYVLQEDGTSFNENFPFTSPSESPLTSAVLSNFLSGGEPEIAVAARNWTIHTFYGHNGEQTPWSPYNTTTGWYLFGAPVIGLVSSTASDIVIGDRGSKGWAFSNMGRIHPGWPARLNRSCNLSPALGDLDGDGLTEAVFLTDDKLFVFNLNIGPATIGRSWPMYGFNSQRTGCLNCPVDFVLPAPEDGIAITRVSFSQPSPNPMTTSSTFRFTVPVRSAASLQIFDIRGHLVRTVLREEVELGESVISWDGHDSSGRKLSSGQYFARLRVNGPGVREDMVRKIVMLR